ncbi:transposase IS116/IS110/IS902 family protein [Tepidamorphus gemmatus]|uniref:Transposase IS116/IS110/IS902 family protein n=1 Tax=Tepidamorphus gemmatus TaxID=747076 RepID=A0A4R3MF60_9HYPH|nr:transposase [Tepidamorphus gemmatus]TCT12469.1 transposase IS116/IS110/IS902 family protein [Tepidamorphus gemmatus]
MTAPGVEPITAMAVVAAFDDACRFRRSSSAGAHLGLTPRRYASGKISRNGQVSKRGDGFTRRCLFEAANAIFRGNLDGPRLPDWVKAIAERTGPRKAKVALAGPEVLAERDDGYCQPIGAYPGTDACVSCGLAVAQ